MNSSYRLFIILLCFLCARTGCITSSSDEYKETSNSVPMSFDPIGRMHLKVKLNEKLTDVIFDTGASELVIDYDSIQCRIYPDSSYTINNSYISNSSKIPCINVKQRVDIAFGDSIIRYNEFVLDSVASRFGVAAIVPIPANDKHVWNIDYYNRALTLVDSIPSFDANLSPIKSEIFNNNCDICVNFPMSINDNTCNNLIINGVIDTGSGGDITSYGGLYPLGDKRFQDVLSQKSRYSYLNSSTYFQCIQQCEPFSDIVLIKVIPSSDYAVLTFGNSLLAHYKIWLDMNNKEMYAVTVNDYISPYYETLINKEQAFNFKQTSDGLLVEYCIIGSSFWNAGLRKGDVIVKVGEKPFNVISKSDLYDENGESTHCTLNVIRGNEYMTFYVN